MPAVAPDEPQDEIDALYRLPLPEFTPARNALAKLRKARGDAAGADAVKGLAKPNVSAWAVNQLWWRDRALFDALLAAGDAVRHAAQRGAGPAEQQGPAQQRRQALVRLVQAAEQRLGEAGHAASAGTMRRITTTLEACAAFGSRLPTPGPGRLADDLDPPGFEVLAGLMATSDVVERPAPAANVEPPAVVERPPRPTAQERIAKQIEDANAQVRELAAAVDAAATKADEARIVLDAKLEVFERLERAAVLARAAADEAKRDADTARRAADAADRTLLDARARADEARREVQRLRAKAGAAP